MKKTTRAAPRGRPGDADHMGMVRARLAEVRERNKATGIGLRERRAAIAIERERQRER